MCVHIFNARNKNHVTIKFDAEEIIPQQQIMFEMNKQKIRQKLNEKNTTKSKNKIQSENGIEKT